MSYAFSNNSSAGKMAFGQLMTQQYASDYTAHKRNRAVLRCQFPMQYYVYPNTFELVNKTQLNYNLFTELNLCGVDVLQNNGPPSFAPTTVDPYVNFNHNYFMDPEGQLFGNTYCGYNSYRKYLRFT